MRWVGLSLVLLSLGVSGVGCGKKEKSPDVTVASPTGSPTGGRRAGRKKAWG